MQMAKLKGLGRGLDALLSGSEERADDTLTELAVGLLKPGRFQPRTRMDPQSIAELADSIKAQGLIQPILVRPVENGKYEIIAGERRWRASLIAGLADIPALVEDIDDDTALEISIIENLQREDISPLDEAAMYDRMIREHGYSIRRLAEKLGKDKGYLENRLRLADAPDEVRELVSLRKDTLSHAYELMKVQDPKKRKRLAEQVARNELSLVKLRERIEGRPARQDDDEQPEAEAPAPEAPLVPVFGAEEGWAQGAGSGGPVADDSLVVAKQQLNDAVEELLGVIRNPDVLAAIGSTDRTNLAKYLTIAKLRLENAIAVVRTGDMDR